MTDRAARLSVERLSKSFGPICALAGVDLRVRPGRIHAVVGENGAGKSTLMRILSGELAPDGGRMRLDGAPFAPSSPAAARRAGVAIVSQELTLCPELSVGENVMLGREPTRFGLLDGRARDALALAAVRRVAGAELAAALGANVAVGQLPAAGRQLVEIARAVAAAPTKGGVLILDEPTSSIGRADAARLFAVLRELCQGGVAVLYVSHFLDEVAAIADDYTVLRDGRSVGSGKMADSSAAGLVRLMVGRELDGLYRRTRRKPGAVLLDLRELGAEPRPRSASLALRSGEVLGIAGLVGSGRTELLRAIFGLAPVVRGEIRVKQWSGAASPRRRWQQGVGLVSEDRKGEGLAVSRSIADNLTLSRLPARGPLGWITPSRQRAIAASWIEKLSIRARDPDQSVAELSGGNQQKVALGRLLHHGVDVLLLDEPTRGIDVGSKSQIYALIDALATEGKAVLVVSTELPELLGLCDRIAVMHRGALGTPRPATEWSEQSLLEAATGAGATVDGSGGPATAMRREDAGASSAERNEEHRKA